MDRVQLAREILKSSNGSVDYWVCHFESISIKSKIYVVDPTLARITLKDIAKERIWCALNGNKNLYIDVIDFTATSIKNGQNISLHKLTGNDMIDIFPDKNSRVKAFNRMIYNCLEEMKVEHDQFIEKMNQKITRLERAFINSDYLMEKLTYSSF